MPHLSFINKQSSRRNNISLLKADDRIFNMRNLWCIVYLLSVVAISNCEEKASDKAVNKRSLNHGVWNNNLGGDYTNLGQNTHTHSVHTITKKIGIPQPYPVTITKHVPVNVPQPYPVAVEVKVPVEVPKPYPVTVTRTVPYPVEKTVYVPQPVKVHVPQPYPVPHPVEVKVPTPVYIKESSYNHGHGNSYGYGGSWNGGGHGGGLHSFTGTSGTYSGIYVPSSLGGLHGQGAGRNYNSGWQSW